MSWKAVLRPTNRKVRWLVGLLLAGLLALQATRSEAWNKGSGVVAIGGRQIGSNADLTPHLERMAKTDHIALLDLCIRNCRAKYHDFTGTFTKQEVIGGTTKALQVMNVKFMDAPFSVAMHWVKNAPLGDTILYVEGQRNNQMLVRPTSNVVRAFMPTALRQPDGEEAMRNTLRPVNLFGFERGLSSLLDVYRKAQAAGDLKQSFDGYKKVYDRECLKLVRELPGKPAYRCAAAKTVIFIDIDYLVPIRIEGYDADGAPNSLYEYSNLKFNVGLASKDFKPETNGMQSPK